MFMTLLPPMFMTLLPHMFFAAAHAEQLWLIQAVVIRAVICFWPNCETAQNVFKNRLIQDLSSHHFFCQLLERVKQLSFLCQPLFLSYRNLSNWTFRLLTNYTQFVILFVILFLFYPIYLCLYLHLFVTQFKAIQNYKLY